MKIIIYLFLFTPGLFNAQELNSALNLHNLIRGYYSLKPLGINDNLTLIAEERADIIAEKDSIVFSENEYGESVFYTSYLTLSRDYFLEATLAWTFEDFDQSSFKQITCKECREVGFGVAMNDDKIYVVAVYDKIFSNSKTK